MKNEPVDYNNYEPPPPPSTTSTTSRLQCRMVPYGHHAVVQQTTPVGEGYYQRNSSLTGYQYPVKYYPMPAYEYSEEKFENDFNIQTTYPTMNSEQLISPNYSIASANRSWTPTAQLPKNVNTPVYLEQDSTYNHGQLAYQSYPYRPSTINAENKASVLAGQILSGSLPALPAPASGNDRVLPFPAANRSQTYVRSNNGLPSASMNYQSYEGLMGTKALVSSINDNSVSSNSALSASYMAYSSSSPESLSSSQTAYSSQAMSQQSADVYTPSSNEGLFHPSESSESSYGTSSEAPKRGSSSSQGGQNMSSLSQGNLVNGHPYVPYNSAATYPAPPMDLHHASQNRRVSTGISAA